MLDGKSLDNFWTKMFPLNTKTPTWTSGLLHSNNKEETHLLQAEFEDILTAPYNIHSAAGVRDWGGGEVHHGGPVLVPHHSTAAQLVTSNMLVVPFGLVLAFNLFEKSQ